MEERAASGGRNFFARRRSNRLHRGGGTDTFGVTLPPPPLPGPALTIGSESAAMSNANDADHIQKARARSSNTHDVELIQKVRDAHAKLRKEIGKVIVGQNEVVDQLLMAIFCRSHALLMGVP